MRKLALLFGLLIHSVSFAEIRIAFIEMRDRDGKILQLETGGRFSHIAISYQDRWLHTHPYRGVELVRTEDLERMGSLVLVSLPKHQELTTEIVQYYLNRPYDSTYSWDGEAFYCSKLVGKILDIAPEPMKFQASIWKNTKQKNDVGLSPDDVYRKITSGPYLGKIIQPRCEAAF